MRQIGGVKPGQSGSSLDLRIGKDGEQQRRADGREGQAQPVGPAFRVLVGPPGGCRSSTPDHSRAADAGGRAGEPLPRPSPAAATPHLVGRKQRQGREDPGDVMDKVGAEQSGSPRSKYRPFASSMPEASAPSRGLPNGGNEVLRTDPGPCRRALGLRRDERLAPRRLIRPASMPIAVRLKRAADAQQRRVGEGRADQLHADRKTAR